MLINSTTQNISIIALPFSGGSGYAFQPLAKYYPPNWKVTTLFYPGRGFRIGEDLVYRMEDLLEDSWQQVKEKLHQPYVLFGHSLGATLAYLLARKIIANKYPLPIHLILSGTDGPSVPSKQPYRYLYNKADFKAKLDSYGGIAPEILEDDTAFAFFEPIIRADFQVVETWQYQAQTPLAIPATVITGTEEDMTEEEIQQWQKEFSQAVTFKKMPGNHFFLFEQPRAFVQLCQQAVEKTQVKM